MRLGLRGARVWLGVVPPRRSRRRRRHGSCDRDRFGEAFVVGERDDARVLLRICAVREGRSVRRGRVLVLVLEAVQEKQDGDDHGDKGDDDLRPTPDRARRVGVGVRSFVP